MGGESSIAGAAESGEQNAETSSMRSKILENTINWRGGVQRTGYVDVMAPRTVRIRRRTDDVSRSNNSAVYGSPLPLPHLGDGDHLFIYYKLTLVSPPPPGARLHTSC